MADREVDRHGSSVSGKLVSHRQQTDLYANRKRDSLSASGISYDLNTSGERSFPGGKSVTACTSRICVRFASVVPTSGGHRALSQVLHGDPSRGRPVWICAWLSGPAGSLPSGAPRLPKKDSKKKIQGSEAGLMFHKTFCGNGLRTSHSSVLVQPSKHRYLRRASVRSIGQCAKVGATAVGMRFLAYRSWNVQEKLVFHS